MAGWSKRVFCLQIFIFALGLYATKENPALWPMVAGPFACSVLSVGVSCQPSCPGHVKQAVGAPAQAIREAEQPSSCLQAVSTRTAPMFLTGNLGEVLLLLSLVLTEGILRR